MDHIYQSCNSKSTYIRKQPRHVLMPNHTWLLMQDDGREE